MHIVSRACRRWLAAIPVAALALLTVAPPTFAAPKPAAAPAAKKPAVNPGQPDLTVMTRNLYVGADILAVAGAEDFADFLVKAREFIVGVAATSYPERAEALAAEIADKKPDVVGMQEVYDFTLNGQHVGVPFVDYLEVLLAALEARGVRYTAVATVREADIVAPADLDGNGEPESMVGVLDRDVILVRAGLTASRLDLSGACPGRVSGDGCNYAYVAEVSIPGLPPITFQRGYVAAQVWLGAVPYFVFNTHLEVRTPAPDNPYSAVVQAIQATELKSVVDGVPAGPRVIVTGDLNSSPEDQILPVPPPLQALGLPPVINPPYRQFSEGENFYGASLGAGYWDAWTLRPGRPPGLSCCQDADLLNPWSALYERIDLVFSRDLPAGVKANQVGNSPGDRTPSGLWPSDHAGLVVRYTF